MKALALTALAACGSTIPSPRFVNAPPVTIVDDRRDVTHTPKPREFLPNLYFVNASVHVPIDRLFDLPRTRRALGVNALDEVPDSTWFTNRITKRTLTPDDVKRGPVGVDPYAHRPWSIRSTKVGGTTPGFVVEDATKTKYLLKFDGVNAPPELETATHVICNRLMWAAGYNVAEDQIFYIKPADLVIGHDAKKKDQRGKTLGPLTDADVKAVLATIRHEPDGRIRTLVSRWIDGTTLGGFASEGVRDDDPNDLIPHQHRRDLRGLVALDAWLDAVDVTEGQFVDAYVADPTYPARHYVKHYAVDFGKSLGAMEVIDHDWWRGSGYRIDMPDMLHMLLTLGFDERPWQHREGPQLRGVSSMFLPDFDPDAWRPDTPGFIAFLEADRFDRFWGARLVATFTREQLAAAVAAGALTDPRAASHLVDVLVARQRIVAKRWLALAAPIENVAIGTDGLCFDDLAIRLGFANATATSYVLRAFDRDGDRHSAPLRIASSPTGRTCMTKLPLATEGDRYTIYELRVDRPGFAGVLYVHLAVDDTGAPRVIGLWRT